MPRGRKPGTPKTGGRTRGTPNRRMKVTALLTEAQKSFDPYGELEKIAKDFLAQVAEEKQRPNPDTEHVNELLEMAARVLKDMVPYRLPRLTATKVSGDKDAPLFDLSALSDSELVFLRRTVLKAQQVDEGE
jgi:hypothetical protein